MLRKVQYLHSSFLDLICIHDFTLFNQYILKSSSPSEQPLNHDFDFILPAVSYNTFCWDDVTRCSEEHFRLKKERFCCDMWEQQLLHRQRGLLFYVTAALYTGEEQKLKCHLNISTNIGINIVDIWICTPFMPLLWDFH